MQALHKACCCINIHTQKVMNTLVQVAKLRRFGAPWPRSEKITGSIPRPGASLPSHRVSVFLSTLLDSLYWSCDEVVSCATDPPAPSPHLSPWHRLQIEDGSKSPHDLSVFD